jgi:7-keto-8-aminopelargonate synthetase-like enzyme
MRRWKGNRRLHRLSARPDLLHRLLANLAVTPTLAGRGDAVFADKLNHASLIDAMQLAKAQGAETQRYPHNDMAALEKMLAASSAATKIIVSDAVFSMDGDLAPLPLLFALAERYDAWLVIDDAHGFGVLGPHGRGSLAHFNLPASPRILLMGTLGKAAGVGGAFVAGSETAIEYLLQKGRSYIFTTATPPAIACALSKSLQLIANGDALRANLMARIAQLRDGLAGLPWQLLPSASAIQPLIVGDKRGHRCAGQGLMGTRPVGAGDPPAHRAERHGAPAHFRFRRAHRSRHRPTDRHCSQGTGMNAPSFFSPAGASGAAR